MSPGSSIFPDGIFTSSWFSKHQSQIPALLLAFFHISATDSNSTDEQLKVDINAVRTAIQRSGYRTKFAVILLSDKSILNAPELEERLSSIRRLTSLDSKTGLFFMPPMNSAAEIATFVHSVMATTLQPLVIDYYRDLTKHARRKKGKGGPISALTSSTTASAGTSALSTVGWNARYEIKQAVFAEFRQEMDVAEHHYSTALDDLFSSEGVFETTPSWSARWEEARLLADPLALRQLRCLLWSERTTAAAQLWSRYQNRMRDLIDRRGKGSGTYGWAAWRARWAQIVAGLIQRAEILPAPTSKSLSPGSNNDSASIEDKQMLQIFAAPEKNVVTTMERLLPWRNLHHAGYWFYLATRESRETQRRVSAALEDDSSSSDTERANNYDTYLFGKPHDVHNSPAEMVASQRRTLTEPAINEFDTRRQGRMSDIMKLELARDLVEVGLHADALQILVPLRENSSWRNDDWHDLFLDLSILVRDTALQQGRDDVVLAATYELISLPTRQPDANAQELDLMNCLKAESTADQAHTLKFEGIERLSPVTVSFAFEKKETHVGEVIGCQVVIEAHMRKSAASVVLKSLDLQIGNTRSIQITHDAEHSDVYQQIIDLSNASEASNGAFEAHADLSIEPSTRRIYNFPLTFRTADTFALTSASFCIETDAFKIEHSFLGEDITQSDAIYVTKQDTLERRLLPHRDTATVVVLPKPPKLRILVHGLRKRYYTDEMVKLGVEVVNDESETVAGVVTASSTASLQSQWLEDTETNVDEQSFSSRAILRTIESLKSLNTQSDVLAFKAPNEPTKASVAIEVAYRLSSDDTTTLRKTMTLDLEFVNPFEVKFTFGSLLYKAPWPSYFDSQLKSTPDNPGGIPQLWRLSTHITSLAIDSIMLRNVAPIVDSIVGDSIVNISDPEPASNEPFEPGNVERTASEISTQKLSLDDRRATTVESTLEITWARDEHSPSFTTRLPVPRLTLPVSEPRVLCTLSEVVASDNEKTEGLWDATLLYYIENPSTHFLTFALTMEATEEFAFSGPRYRTLSLAPLSRHKVAYQLALQDQSEHSDTAASGDTSNGEKGRWIWPSLQVIDSYYQRTLRVHPGSSDVKFDENQNIAVFINDK